MGKVNGGRRPGAGRPLREFTDQEWKQLENMATIHCTMTEIENIIGADADTLNRACRLKFKTDFSVWCEQKRSNGKMSLRRAMYKKALETQDNTMLIWLSKNELKMTDKVETVNIEQNPITVQFTWGDQHSNAESNPAAGSDPGVKGKV